MKKGFELVNQPPGALEVIVTAYAPILTNEQKSVKSDGRRLLDLKKRLICVCTFSFFLNRDLQFLY